MESDGVGQLAALTHKWFPDRVMNVESMGEALWLERDYWEKMSVAVANGIAMAFSK